MTAPAQQPLGLTDSQADALERFAKLRVGAAFMEQGMGKSRVAVELANSRAEHIDDVLWVAPYSVLATVEAEVAKWGCDVPVRFVGYQTLSQSDTTYLEVLEWAQERRLFIIADESTFIKNAWAKRHQRMTELRKHAEYALALNGTPLTRDLWDVKRQMDWLSPRIIDTDDRAFRGRYFTMHSSGKKGALDYRIWFDTFAPNVAHLAKLIEPYVFEARLSIGVPEHELEAYHPVSGSTSVAYEKERDEFLEAWAQWGEELALFRMLGNLKRIAAVDPRKCRSIAEKVEGRHTVVFCQYLEEMDLIAQALDGPYMMVHGDTPQAERDKIFERFKTEAIPLLLTYGVGSYGLNLQHVNEAHFASLPFNYGEVEQARSRIRRLGQERPITYVTHSADLGIDTLVQRNIRKKKWLASLVRHEIDPTTVL